MGRAFAFPLALCGVFACRPSAPVAPPHATAAASSVPTARVEHRDPPPSLAQCTLPVTKASAHVTERSAALQLLLDGKPREAERAFDKVLASKPTDVASYALRVAASSTISAAFAERVRHLEHVKPISVTTSFASYALTSALTDLPKTPASLELKVVSTSKGPGVSSPDWFTQHGVTQPDLGDDDLPSTSQQLQGLFFSRSNRAEDHEIAFFGDSLVTVSRDGASSPKVVDFTPAMQNEPTTTNGSRPGIVFVRVVGKSAIVEISTTNDAATGTFPNGFLVAVDLEKGAVSWVSEPNIASASSFVVSGHFAIVGDGVFAQVGANPGHGFIRVVDLANGKVVDKKAIDTYPMYLVEKDGKILVEGYDGGEVVLAPSEPLAKAPAADLPGGGVAATPSAEMLERTRCFIERGALALDARDGKRALAEMDLLDDREGRPASAIRAAGSFLIDAATRPDDVVDLTAKEPLVIEDLTGHANARTLGPAPRLTKKESQSTKPPQSKDPLGRSMPMPSPPPMEYTPGVTFPVPDVYAGVSHARSFAYEDGNILLYGTQYVAVLRGHKLENVFDIQKLLNDGAASASLVHAGLKGETLFLAVSGPSSSGVFAIDASNGKVLWRSDKDTCSVRFAVVGDYLVTAAATHATRPGAKPQSSIYVLRSDTGAVVSKTPLPSTPSDLGLAAGSRIVAVTESDYVTFSIGY